ncbi:class I adenylate-forming enzyme family protein [Euzebya pacifica]|uniref:class I adenylate-forming enzyme family protein n=1 Tax=Euzebya pacifica TaxID=1608957 RepID=UPI0030FACC86
MNVGLTVTRSARRYPHRVAAFDDTGELTWVELDRRSNQVAHMLADMGVDRGDRVALLAPNRLEVCEVLAGVAKAGMVYVGLNFRLSATDLSHILGNAEPSVIIASADLAELAHEVADPAGIPVLELDDPGQEGWAARRDRAATTDPATLHEIRPEDEFCIVYTSGTTGTPKGVWFDHSRVMQHAPVACMEYEIDHTSRYLVAIPHNSSVNITLVPCMMVGAAVGFVDSRGFDPQSFVDAVAHHRATHTYLVPTQLYRLLDRIPAGSTALDGLVTVGYGAAPMAPDKARALVERFGPIFVQLYGMAEVASIGTMLRKADHLAALDGRPELFGSAGQSSYLMDVRVVDADGRDVDTGERGEVIFAAPYMMKGYYGEPERTAQTLVDGWVRSGDIATVDADGFLYIVDRVKDIIIRGGYNIAPSEVEAVIHRHPDVLEVAVIGVPDERWGEAIEAVVALRSDTVDLPDLQTWCKQEGLSSLKVPETIVRVDSLPKNAVGKIDKASLRSARWSTDRRV